MQPRNRCRTASAILCPLLRGEGRKGHGGAQQKEHCDPRRRILVALGLVQEDRKTGRQEDRKTGRQEDRMTG
jgi:hypothetical protein